jgi:ankyrin repeat protein
MRSVDLELLQASATGDLNKLLNAIHNGANINIKDDRGFTSLHFALYNNKLEILQVLVQTDINVNEVGKLKLMI